MHKVDLNKVVFYSKDDMAGSMQLKKGEIILKKPITSTYADINEVLELYNIKKYFDNELYLSTWSQDDTKKFIKKVAEYSEIVGQFMSSINDSNVIHFYYDTIRAYTNSFWELVNNQNVFKKISKKKFNDILLKEPHLIHNLLTHKKIVEHYNIELKDFLLTYSQSAEILLSIYEVKDHFNENHKFLPKALTMEDKESIVLNYLDAADVNLNYIELIQNVKTRSDFRISDKTKLKAKRLYKSKLEKIFSDKEATKYGVAISFPSKVHKIKDRLIDDENITNYSYSLDFIKENNSRYNLYKNFKLLFEYVDLQNRITLVSKRSQLGLFEKIIGVHTKNQYRVGQVFRLSEMRSHLQIVEYDKIVLNLSFSLVDIFHHVFTSSFQEKYKFAKNARFSIPSNESSHFEKVRFLAPEFESILKQFKLFVEEGAIDFDLLQISSLPTAIKDIPSHNPNKYIYLNENNEIMVNCFNLFFSDQTLLNYVEPFKEKEYNNLFDLLLSEKVKFNSYEDFQKLSLYYLIENGFLHIDSENLIQITNIYRVIILKDLFDNEVASLHHYSPELRNEAKHMAAENIVFFESSLFSRSEQAYFNYFLNKSEFTNGVDLRNSYLHGTQANPDEIKKHENAYYRYLKLLFLVLLKIEDDLSISKAIKNRS